MHVWCIGNEMDGPWQIGHLEAVEYGRKALEAGKVMRLVDPSVELVVCGSSNTSMPTFGAWEDTVLDLAWEVADHISLHTYYDPAKFESPEAFLGAPLDLDRMIETVAATADAVAGRKGDRRRVMLSVDEWNVWYQTPREAYERKDQPFVEAPPLIEDTYNVTDALVVGSCLITLLRHADRVKMACLAQLVNVIAPIRTENGGPAWRQTSYYPFQQAARYGRGTVLRVEPEVATYEAGDEPAIPLLDATAVHDGADGLALFMVNRSAEPLSLEAEVRGLGSPAVAEHLVLADADPAAVNTASDPDRVVPRSVDGATVDGGVLRARLEPRSWNVLRLSGAA